MTAYSSRTGTLEWRVTLTGFPAGAAIVSVRAWPGEVTAGVSYRPAGGAPRRTEVALSGTDGTPFGRYPAGAFGGAVAGSQQDTVVVGNGDAWGYDLAVQRVTLAASGLPWPHYFVDLSGVGGSAAPAGNLVIIAACRQLAPVPSASPGTSALPASPAVSAPPASPAASAPPSTPAAPGPGGGISTPAGSHGSQRAGQSCMRPELAALKL